MTSGPQSRQPAFYRPELDGLRFFAFFFVFIGHALSDDATYYTDHGVSWTVAHLLSHIVHVGRYGVPLFFVLSSYLITELLIREHEQTGTIDVKRFYLRRALRIWPLYFVFVFLASATLRFEHGTSAIFPAKYLAGMLLFFGNWAMALKWGPAVGDDISGPLWSVSVEEQFYLGWPLVLSIVGVHRIRQVALVLIAMAVTVRLAMDLSGTLETTAWYGTFTWLDAIAAGALLAIVFRGGAPNFKPFTRGLLFVGGFGLWLLSSVVFKALPLSSTFYPLIVGGSVLFYLGAAGSEILGHPVLVYLGRMSYGLYVIHKSALALASYAFPLLSAGNALFGLAITIVLAALSYRWLETPFLRLKKRFTYVESRPVDEPIFASALTKPQQTA